MYTLIPYLYRDASNYKQSETIVIEGKLSAEDIALVRSRLDAGENFIPGDLGLNIEELQPRNEGFPSADDHVWHELQLEALETSETAPKGSSPIAAAAFVAAFARFPRRLDAWDVIKAVERLGLGY